MCFKEITVFMKYCIFNNYKKAIIDYIIYDHIYEFIHLHLKLIKISVQLFTRIKYIYIYIYIYIVYI